MTTGIYNVTIDDSSPMIKYEPSGAWSANVSADPNLKQYYQSSYHYTTAKNASASLTFLGTGVTIIGSRSIYHGAFELRIDSQKINGLNSFIYTRQYRVYLASIRGLPFGNHTVQFVNRSGGTGISSLDIDAFVVETNASGGGTGNSTVVPAITIDDGSVSSGTNKLTWSDGWAKQSKSANSNSVFLNGTVHETTTKGSSVTLNFVGEGVQVIGAVGPNNTLYNVQVDNGTAVDMNAKTSGFTPSSTLFYQTNLPSGAHKVVITNTATDGGALTIDSFQVFGANTAATTANSTSTSTSTSDSNSGPNGGLIAAGVIGGLLVLLLILGVGFFLWRRKRNNDEDDETDKFSIAQMSYIERVRNINFTLPAFPGRKKNTTNSAGLSRSASRGSEETIVDPESGNLEHTQKKGMFGYGFGLGAGPKKWLDNVKGMVVRNPDPSTPPLPVQNQQRERPMIDIRNTNGVSPGMVTVGLESGVPGGNTGYAAGRNNPDPAQVWMAGTQRIEASRRFSNQSLEQAWDNRGHATGEYDHYGGHRRNRSSPSERPQVPWTGPREADEEFRVSSYQRSQLSPSVTDYPETPVRPRYEIEQRHSPMSSRYATNGRGQRSDFR